MALTKKSEETLAIFVPAEEGGFNVSFPDFPGCFTFGRTLAEAKRMAREVLELWIEELESTQSARSKPAVIANVPLPKPSRFSHTQHEIAHRQKARARS